MLVRILLALCTVAALISMIGCHGGGGDCPGC
jgi:hypothetical protein